jgi:hypothetical protein
MCTNRYYYLDYYYELLFGSGGFWVLLLLFTANIFCSYSQQPSVNVKPFAVLAVAPCLTYNLKCYVCLLSVYTLLILKTEKLEFTVKIIMYCPSYICRVVAADLFLLHRP